MKKVAMKPTMKKAMKKAMKEVAMKPTMKKAMKKAMKVSIVAKGSRARHLVFKGTKDHTSTGLKKGDLMRNSRGKLVTKKAHANGIKNYSRIKGWIVAVAKAKKAMGITGFIGVKK